MKNLTLIAARKKSGKTQKQVAKELGIFEQAERLIFVAKCVTAVNVLIGILQLITLWKVLQ